MKDIAELNKLYSDAESVDADLFAEQKSNVRLVIGDHYTNKNSRFWNRIRDAKQITNEQKIRLTKNHIQKICKTYLNNVVSHAPGVAVTAKNESELQDMKAAELNESVWQDLKERNKLRAKIRQWAKDYIDIGEVVVKAFWDPSAGELKGFEAEVERDDQGEPIRDEMGNVIPVMDENGQMVQSNKAVFSGAIVYERFFAFDSLRDPGAKNWDECKVVILRKMVPIPDLKAKVGSDPDKLKMIQESSQNTYQVFDGASGSYRETKDQCMVREYFYRKCAEYPQGYFYITTESGILFEGELPFGIWPIKYAGFDEVATSPRSRSIIKVCRPYQAEINRSASKIAEHQVTLGDDKLLIQSGTKITHGGTLAGVRGIQYSGTPPGILQGRSGEQYLAYMQSQILEMYQASNVNEDSQETTNANTEPYTMLYRSIRNKKKFSLYGMKFEEFLVDICETSLELAKNYYTDDMLIPAIGKREMVNMAEFRNANKLCYTVKVEPQVDDIETKMGKQLAMTQVIQYVGKELGKDAIGRIIRAMPFVNEDEAFNDLTIDYDNSVNDILALDRGEYPEMNPEENHVYIIKRLTQRMKQSDFKFLPLQIKMNYQRCRAEHEMIEVMQKRQILAAQADFIPTGGYLVTCDFYVNDPSDPARTRRARLPYQSVDWLIKRLGDQGMSLQSLEGMQQSALAEMGGMLKSGQGQGMPAPRPQLQQQKEPYQGPPQMSATQMQGNEPGLIPAQLGAAY